MKKKLVASLAAAMVLSVAGTSFAASNPFVDLPAKHWAYESVTKLAQAGIVDGYNDGTFRGDKTMSRYEMAQIVAKAMARSDKADAAQKAAIDKLTVEFASELEGLNVRVTKIQDKVDKFDMNGVARVRYDHKKDDGVLGQNINLDVFYSYKVNDEWTVKGESEFNRDLRDAADNSNNNQFEQLYVTGPIAGTTIKAGKFTYTPTYGVLFDNKVSGAQISFGKEVRTTLNVGKTDAVAGAPNVKYEAIDVAWAYSKDTNIKANYQKLSDVGTVKAYEVGFDTKLGTDYGFQAAYAKTDVPTENKAYFAQIQYKAANTAVVGSNDIYVSYRKFQQNGTIDPATDYAEHFKGITFGYDYVPAKNIKLGTFYMSGKDTITNNDAKIFRAQAEFFF